ncbi:MAG: 4-hydroxy-3-methylbut-2-enyl diphosphate reductase [Spirosomaceae bacterium]|nr:4-hydroxy-3-methylbut-2-enyl diphosphate reductase [Spirosomataceae bacterium]
MKSFEIPEIYKSNFIGEIKEIRRQRDRLKKDTSPTVLDFGSVKFLLARHFGFCYGVENAVEIAYKTINENVGKRIFFLSEMIHNPDVNADLQSRGVKFLMDTEGNQLVDWNTLTTDDIVVVPAFGTTVEIQSTLKGLGIDPYKYDTTCPFVEKVWKRADQIGNRGYSVIVHGKPKHEETRATFSHSRENAPTVIVRDMEEAQHLAKYIRKELPAERFIVDFAGQFSEYFNPETDLERIGVVNQTTMLASETQGISDYLKSVIVDFYGLSQEESERNFANTRDTLCYATNDNQDATHALLKEHADFAVVVGGYNSSNTMHLVELCEEKLPTYFVESHHQIVSDKLIKHFNLHTKKEEVTEGFIPDNKPVTIMLTCGASCPDAVVEEVLLKLVSFFKNTNALSQVLASL